MFERKRSTWPLPLNALVQLMVSGAFVYPLENYEGSAGTGYLLIAVGFALAIGGGLLFLAVRNCIRAWRIEARAASRALATSGALVSVFAFMVASGPVAVGEFRWFSIVFWTFGVFLCVLTVREVRRLLRSGRGGLSAPQQTTSDSAR